MKRKGTTLSVVLATAALLMVAAIYLFTNTSSPSRTETQSQTQPTSDSNKNAVVHTESAQSLQTKDTALPADKVDVLIVGSELEGLYLARAAADEGLKVKVIDPREAFGGQVLQGEMLFLDETRDDKHRLLVQGRAKELFDGFRQGKIRKLKEFEQYFEQLSKDIPVEQGVVIEGIELQPGEFGPQAVKAVVYKSKDGQKKRIEASYWVDNTDFAALVGKLQVPRLPGLEAFYGQNNVEYMSAGLMMKFKNVDWAKFQKQFNELTKEERNAKYGWGSVDGSFAISLSGMTSRYKPTNDRVFLRGLNAVNQRDGEVLINAFLIYTVDPSNDASIREAMELGKKEMPLILEHFRKNIVGWEHAELNGFPNYLYVREYNHYETDYVLKPSDMLGAKMFWDNVSIAGYPLDLQGTSANKWGIEMGRPDKYGMPLRSFLLKGFDNVIMAGKKCRRFRYRLRQRAHSAEYEPGCRIDRRHPRANPGPSEAARGDRSRYAGAPCLLGKQVQDQADRRDRQQQADRLDGRRAR